MSVLWASTAAGVYATAMIGAHRWNVRRRRAKAGGFRALERIDWGTLLDGLLPVLPGEPHPGIPAHLPSGAPTPQILRGPLPPEVEPRRRILLGIVAGHSALTETAAFVEAGFSGGQAGWLTILATLNRDPDRALEKLEQQQPTSASELYLREYLRLTRRLNPINLEVAVFASKRRLTAALERFGDQPALYFARALASARIGFIRAAIDDLARAVYFSGQAPFYVHAVLDTPFLTEARPALVFQCRQRCLDDTPIEE